MVEGEGRFRKRYSKSVRGEFANNKIVQDNNYNLQLTYSWGCVIEAKLTCDCGKFHCCQRLNGTDVLMQQAFFEPSLYLS